MRKIGKTHKFRDLIFWPEQGLIHIEDTATGEYNIVTVREFLYRARAINQDLHRNRWPSERDELQTFVEHAIHACREAKNQGRPDDPKAVEQMLKERRKSMVLVPGQRPYSHAASSLIVPEGAKLPPVPKAPPNKPIKHLDPAERSIIVK